MPYTGRVRWKVGGGGGGGGGIWGATPRNFLKINPSFLQSVVALIKFLKDIFLIVCGTKSVMLSNKSAVWCSRDMLLMLGGLRGHPQKLLKINPSFLQSGALCGSFVEILKGYFLYSL